MVVRQEAERRIRLLIAQSIRPPIAELVRLSDESKRSLPQQNRDLKSAADRALQQVLAHVGLAEKYKIKNQYYSFPPIKTQTFIYN